MGKQRSRSLGSASTQVRLSYSSRFTSLALTCANSIPGILSGLRQISGASRRSGSACSQRSDRTDRRGFSSRLLQSPFCSSQVIRGLEAGFGCERPELACPENKISYGDHSVGSGVHQTGGLDGLSGHARRLFSHSDTSRISEVPEVHVRRQGVSVSGALLRTSDRSSSFHQGSIPDRKLATHIRSKNLPLSGRLASPVGIRESVHEGPWNNSGSCQKVRNSGQQTEVPVGSISEHPLFGDDSECSSFSGFSVPEEGPRLSGDSSGVLGQKGKFCQSVDEAPGQIDVSGEICDVGKTAHETSAVFPESLLVQEDTTRLDYLSCHRSNKRGPKVVALSSKVGRRVRFTTHPPEPTVLFRRIGHRLGSPTGKSTDFRSLVGEGEEVPHKCKGTVSNFLRAQTVSELSRRPSSGSAFRQLHGSLVRAETGGDSVFLSVRSSQGSPPVVKRSEGSASPEICSGKDERPGGRVKSSTASVTSGVDFGQQDLSETLAPLGTTVNRPVRDIKEQPSSSLLFSSPRSSSLVGGRNAVGLVGSGSLCIPSVRSNKRGAEQVHVAQQCNANVNRSLLAQERVVPGPSPVVSRLPQTSSSREVASQTTSLQEVPPKLVRSSSDRVQTVRNLVRAKGFSRRAAEAIARCRRESSNKLYQGKWRIFREWCRSAKVSTSATSLTEIADFLLFLRNSKKLAPSTIRGYRAMLSSVFRHRGLDISSNSDLSDLIRSFETTKLPQDTVAWNLDVVLKFLMGPPFEPLKSASLRNLTKKALFLIALASAKRVSELHAIDKRVGFSQGNAVFSVSLTFLAKNENPSNPWPRSFVVRNLSDLVGHEEEERLLCPVRAIKQYLFATKGIRGQSSKLWTSVQNPSRPLSKNAISFFIRELIREAHSQSENDNLSVLRVKAHEVRAVATSLAFRKNLSLASILQSTFWRSNSVFASHYLKEIETVFENCKTLGPVAVSGMVLGETAQGSSPLC